MLDEALAWAARSDRAEAVDAARRPRRASTADVYRGTALAWAAARGRVAAIRRLVALGADPNQRTTFGGPQHGEGVTALHLAAQGGHLDAIRALLELGADPTARDGLYDATPAGWAEHGGTTRRASCCAHGAVDGDPISSPTRRRPKKCARPARRAANASTTAGSNWVPAPRRSSASASSGDRGVLYGRGLDHGVEGVDDRDDACAERDRPRVRPSG